MKLEAKWKAVSLRKKGLSYNEIRKNVHVSKGTLSVWLKNIDLTQGQQKKLLKGLERSRYIAAQVKKQERELRTRTLIEEGRKEFPRLIKNPLFLAGLMLYWAEGDKNQAERVKFTNSDETTIVLMMKWFREICDIPEEKFRIALHLHNLHFRIDAQNYWSKITGVPLKQFHRVFIKQSSLRQRRNVLYNGTCAIVINNKSLFRKIIGWKLGLSDYFNITPRSSTDRTRDF